MASGAGFYDANGIYRYGETDQIGLFSDMLNIGMESVSSVITSLRAGRGIVGYSNTQLITSFTSGTPATVLTATTIINPGRRYRAWGMTAVQPSANAGANALYISATTLGNRGLFYRTETIGANLNFSLTGITSFTAAEIGVTTGSNVSRSISLVIRIGANGGIATNPDSIVGANSFRPQLIIEDIGAA